MLRLLIKDITVEKPQPKQLLVQIRWQGGASTSHSVPLLPSIADRMRYPAPLVDRVRDLAQRLTDHTNRRSTQSRRAGQCLRQTFHRFYGQVDPPSLQDPRRQAEAP
jgi:hypothetical protein